MKKMIWNVRSSVNTMLQPQKAVFSCCATAATNASTMSIMVLYGDPTDPDFWMRIKRQETGVRLVMLTLTKHQANLTVTRHLIDLGYSGYISAVAPFDDQIDELHQAGVHAAFNFYNEAGLGFAEHVWSFLERKSWDDE